MKLKSFLGMSAAIEAVPHSGAQNILDAAIELFAIQGFAPVSISQIAARAGVSKANIFHHFESKETLYLSVMRHVSAIHADYAEALYERPGSSESKIRSLIEFEVFNLIENEHRTRLVMRETSDSAHRCVAPLVQDIFNRNFNAVTRLFEQGVGTGEFRRGLDVAAAAMLLHGAAHLFFQCRESLQRFPKALELQDPKVFARRISAIVLSGAMVENSKPKKTNPVSRSRSAVK